MQTKTTAQMGQWTVERIITSLRSHPGHVLNREWRIWDGSDSLAIIVEIHGLFMIALNGNRIELETCKIVDDLLHDAGMPMLSSIEGYFNQGRTL